MRKMFVLLVYVSLLFCSCNKDDETTFDESSKFKYVFTDNLLNKEKTIEYKFINGVDPNLLSLDIYYTKETDKKKPIVIYVHGGGWCLGDKKNNIEKKVSLFQSQNWLFISLNYRLSPFPYQLFNTNRVKYPDHNNDVADAIEWIHDNIDQYGGNSEKIVLLGHSAGAHLVSLTGTNKSFLEKRGVSSSVIKGVASIDTEGYDILEQIMNTKYKNRLYINSFGVNQPQYIDASPIHNLIDDASYPNFFIAKRGSVERKAIANQFIEALKNISISVFQVDGSVYSHSEINGAIGEKNEMVITPPLIEFIKDCVE
ncbi:carboxylesterase family protein [Aquimarina sp. MAR_2010_214]|uniref:alpha/beta hydrolase n=1 Tax=Aquimarina sp. MAR_2010_214 TaxID=1250026 RepID=UPI000CC881A0|nr:alpha/beta hydrolase [Aquimarina sp. MAR_2010_214]PKV49692.1 carboxylesterase family protein [Aquimarina sp. MAR_2010_214]